MLFYLIQFILLLHNCSVGIKYLTNNKKKPKYKSIYYSGDQYIKQREEMEMNFDVWNLSMRRTLEQFYRQQFVYSLSITFQTILLLFILHKGISGYYIGYCCFVVIKSFLTIISVFRLLQVKKQDQYREWKRKDSFIIAEANQNDVLSNEDNMFRANKKVVTSFKLKKLEENKRLMTLAKHNSNLTLPSNYRFTVSNPDEQKLIKRVYSEKKI